MKPPEKITVRETIHHGSYYSMREQVIAPTWGGLLDLLKASPHNQPYDKYAHDNRYVARMFADLLVTGCGEYGWARYEVIA